MNDHFEKIAVLENEVEAQVLDSMLIDAGIPHVLRSYHDFAYDGLFQMQKGWGTVEAPPERRDEVLEILQGLRKEQETVE